MSYRPWEMALGGVVLAAALGFGAYALKGTDLGLGARPGYTLTAAFRSAEGVRPGTEVRLAGVRIGSVSGLRLNPTSFLAEVEIRIEEAIRLPSDSTLAVASEGIMGGVFMEVIPGGMPMDLEPGEAFSDTQSAVGLVQMMLRAFSGGAASQEPETEG